MKQKYQVDDLVEAKVSGWKQMYKGKVTSYNESNNTYGVAFNDGERHNGVKSFNIKSAAETTFRALDGQTFTSKSEYRKYMNDTYFTFKNVCGETLIKGSGDIEGEGFTISDAKGCEIRLMDFSDQVLIDNVTECKILIGPSCGSVFIRHAKNCVFFIACKQFRSRDCSDCTISLYSKTEPVVETSSGMRFYPYSAYYAGQTDHFAKAKLVPDTNHWCNVFDFNKDDNTIPEPHWSLVPEADGWPKWEIPSDNGSPLENPVPSSARASIVSVEGSFNHDVMKAKVETPSNENIPVSIEFSQLPPAAPVSCSSTVIESIEAGKDKWVMILVPIEREEIDSATRAQAAEMVLQLLGNGFGVYTNCELDIVKPEESKYLELKLDEEWENSLSNLTGFQTVSCVVLLAGISNSSKILEDSPRLWGDALKRSVAHLQHVASKVHDGKILIQKSPFSEMLVAKLKEELDPSISIIVF